MGNHLVATYLFQFHLHYKSSLLKMGTLLISGYFLLSDRQTAVWLFFQQQGSSKTYINATFDKKNT